MRKFYSYFRLVLSFMLFAAPVAAQESPEVTLYCQAPNADCDAAATALESRGIEYNHVYAWSGDRSLHRVESLETVYGIHLDGHSAIFKVNDSVGVGVSSFLRLWNFVRNIH